jgi:hypothetical protein
MDLRLGLVISLVACDGSDNPAVDAPVAPPDSAEIDASIDAAEPDASLACAPAVGAGTSHAGTIVDETWAAADSPHIVTDDVLVNGTLTIEACAVVRLAGIRPTGHAASIFVSSAGAGGSLVVAGEAGRAVLFERQDPNAAWGTLATLLNGTMPATLSFTHARIVGGGDPTGLDPRNGAITAGGSNHVVHVDNVVIEDSSSYGVALRFAAAFSATSANLVVGTTVDESLLVPVQRVGTIPAGAYTKRIELDSSNNLAIDVDTTMRDRGTPYAVRQLRVTDNSLTVEPGVRIEIIDFLEISTQLNGDASLVAIGTAANPIVLTRDPSVGFWRGILFRGTVSGASRIQHARVEFAGGVNGETATESCAIDAAQVHNRAAIRLFGPGEPATQFITETVIADSFHHGIDRGYRSDAPIDFLPTNTFVNVPRCKQTFPRTLAGACPDPVPCP